MDESSRPILFLVQELFNIVFNTELILNIFHDLKLELLTRFLSSSHVQKYLFLELNVL